MRHGDVRIDLSGGEGCVAEEFLHDTQVGASIKEVCGEGVPEGMRAKGAIDAGGGEPSVHGAFHGARGEAFSETIAEDGGVWGGAQVGPGVEFCVEEVF